MPAKSPIRRSGGGQRKARTPAQNLKHVVKTWLPPGVSVEEAKDPGTQQRKRARGKAS